MLMIMPCHKPRVATIICGATPVSSSAYPRLKSHGLLASHLYEVMYGGDSGLFKNPTHPEYLVPVLHTTELNSRDLKQVRASGGK